MYSFSFLFSAMPCPQLTPVNNGNVTCSSKIDCTANECHLGTECTFQCNQKYFIKGSRNLKCESPEKWNKRQPTCRSKILF